MKKLIAAAFIFSLSLSSFSQIAVVKSLDEIWTNLLKKYVSGGRVNYKEIKSDDDFAGLFNRFNLVSLSALSKEEKLAFYINVYNASVVKLICDYYPVENINEIKIAGGVKPFRFKFIRISKNLYCLDDIENQLIRGLAVEPRIHFVLVPGGVSSPELATEAFTGENLDRLLKKQTVEFLKNEKFNQIDFVNQSMNLNMIFKWYSNDFGGEDNLRIYISQFFEGNKATSLKAKNFAISFIPYDWNLNNKIQNLYR